MGGRSWRSSSRRAALTLSVCLLAFPSSAARQKPRKVSAPASAPVSPDGSAGRVTDVRFWSLTEATRIAVEVTGAFEYKSDHLPNPDRIFFDLIGVKPGNVPNGIETLTVDDTLVRRIRIAESEPGTTRIVLDMNAPAEATASQLSNPDRLMIEVRPAGTAQPSVTSAGAPKQPTPGPVSTASLPPTVSFTAPAPPNGPAAKMDPSLPSAGAGSGRTAHAAAPPEPAPPDAALPKGPRETPAPTGRTESTRPAAVTVSSPPASTRTPEPPPAQAAQRTSAGERSMIRALGLKLGRVVLDPGHGGNDGGTRGPGGLIEKDLVLDVSRRLGALIEARLGSEVVFTREDDTYVALEERTRIANRHQADLFLSIHANSSPAKSASGIETYYLNFTASKSAMDVAARENASSEESIHDLKDLIQKIALKEKLDESREFAEHVQVSLSTLSAKANSRSRDRGVKKAPFVVLIGASMPSILVEIGFVSNPNDEALMKRPEYRQRIAEALYKGVAQYASGLSHFDVARQKAPDKGQ